MVKQKYPDKELIAVMEPYTFSRFNAFIDEFAHSVRDADKTYICPVDSSAREIRAEGTVDSDVILEKIPNSEYLTLDTISNLNHHQDKIILFMGVAAGKYADAYKNQFTK
jgi:UDP-N-acetylmuramate--alanine ligase